MRYTQCRHAGMSGIYHFAEDGEPESAVERSSSVPEGQLLGNDFFLQECRQLFKSVLRAGGRRNRYKFPAFLAELSDLGHHLVRPGREGTGYMFVVKLFHIQGRTCFVVWLQR